MPQHFVSGPQFERLVAGAGSGSAALVEAFDLERLMLELAHDSYPGLNDEACLSELDRLGKAAREALAGLPASAAGLRRQLTEISRVLYRREGFRGNEEDYYDPKNSYLNEVLDRRRGIPISLGIVYIAVARRAGVDVYGVPTPGHFVLGCSQDGTTLYVDPFADGDVLPLDCCKHRVERHLGRAGVLSDADFRPAGPLEIAVRVLRNLKSAYLRRDQWLAAVPIQERLVRLVPGASDEHRDLGLIYLRVGLANDALPLLARHFEQATEQERRVLARYLRAARRMSAELN